MLRRNLGNIILAVIIVAAILYVIIPFNFTTKGDSRSPAFIAHEDPEITEAVFSGASFLTFSSDYLDYVLQMKPEELTAVLGNWSFANIPHNLKGPIDGFVSSGINLSQLVVATNENLGRRSSLLKQSRFDEAGKLADQISDYLSQADNELEQIEEAIEIVGDELKVSSAPKGSVLRQSYDDLLDRLKQIKGMTASYKGLLEDLTRARETEESLQSTSITLGLEPAVTFVGDNVRFEGILTSEDEALTGRRVDLLVNNSRYLTVSTDAYGHYQGTLQVPYRYVPELSLQALYSPQDKDKGVYLASLSPVVRLKVLFYQVSLEVAVEDKAYPGLETTITGKFDYGQSPPPNERRVEVYVDHVLTSEFIAQEVFSQEIKINPKIDVGEHVITISSPAVGRYALADTSVILNITRAIPVLDIAKPNVAMIPGSVKLEGKLYSEVGPLSEAAIKMVLGKSRVESVSSQDGAFSTKIKAGMGLSLIGWQDLVIQVVPGEPWHAPLNTTSRVFMVNAVNCGILIALILFLGIYLPARLRRRLRVHSMTAARPAIMTVPPETAPTYSETATILAPTEEGDEASAETRNRVFRWYRLAVQVIQGITKTLLKPQQTLREFAEESGRVLGPAARFFIEFTRMVERVLYSPYKPTEKDVEMSRKLSVKIEEAGKLRTTVEALPGEGIITVGDYEFGDKATKSGPWRQPDTWLWVLLILAVTYYACLLLFLLPLVVK